MGNRKKDSDKMIGFNQILDERKKAGMPFDPDQEKAIKRMDNCVVAAGAGSGKTTVLSYRFLYLVMEKNVDVDRILTLTFTRKAAGEMHDRIHALMLKYQNDPKMAKQIALFPHASIATFDSFCSQIVRMDSAYYGIARDFSIDDEKFKQTTLKCCRRFLETDEMEEGFSFLSSIYSSDTLMDSLLLPIAQGVFALPHTFDSEQVYDALVKRFTHTYDTIVAQLVETLKDILSQTPTAKGSKEIVQKASLVYDAYTNSDQEAFLSSLQDLSACKRVRSNSKEVSLRESFGSLKDEIYPQFMVLSSSLQQKENLHKVLVSLSHYQASLFEEKRRSGILTFSDVSSLALDILKRNKELRQTLKNKYSYIMIDEFQDDNSLQKEMLYLLSEKNELSGDGISSVDQLEEQKLFFVGDQKQSIYRFRGADVSVFKTLASELQKGDTGLSIGCNHRSEPLLIDFFNEIFPSIMKNRGEKYEADFEPLDHRQPSAHVQPSIELLVKMYNKDEEAPEGEDLAGGLHAEAIAVAQKIRDMLTSDAYLIPDRKAKSGVRRPRPSDICILMDKLTNQMIFEKALRLYNIPYAVVANKSMMLDAMANDLYGMLQLLFYPHDRLTYTAVLRGPFARLGDDALPLLLDEACEPFEDVVGLSEDNARRYQHLCTVFHALKKKAETHTTTQLLSYLWWDCGLYLYYTTISENQPYLANYDFFYRLARQNDDQGLSLSHFLDTIRGVLGSSDKLSDTAIFEENSDTVEMMTIHKSKGLQFPIVIVAATGSPLRAHSASFAVDNGVPLPYHYRTPDGKYGNALLDFAKDTEFNELLAEKKRLFYVAVTRAETHLLFTGTFSKQNRNVSGNNPATSLLLMLLQSTHIDQDTLEGGSSFIQKRTIIPPVSEQSMRRLKRAVASSSLAVTHKEDWYAPVPRSLDLRPVKVAATSLSEEESGDATVLPRCPSDAILDRLENAYADFGTYTHAVVEAEVLHQPIPTLEEVLTSSSPLLSDAVSQADKKILISDAHHFALRFMESDFYHKEVQPYTVSCEVKFFTAYPEDDMEKAVEGAIDLLIEDDQGNLSVIDFKTDSYRSEEKHATQLVIYMLAVSRLYPGKKVRGSIIYLRENTIVPSFLPFC